MRALVFARGYDASLHPLAERTPAPLLPLAGRPMLHHVVESLALRGVTEIDFVLDHLPQAVEEEMGEGERWGCRFRFHLLGLPGQAARLLRAVSPAWDGETVLLGDARTLPLLPEDLSTLEGTARRFDGPGVPGPGGVPDEETWTGWAVLPAAWLREAPDHDGEPEELLRRLVSRCEGETVPGLIGLRNWQELLDSTERVLSGAFPGLELPAVEVEPGVWIARNVSLHPNTRVHPPVLLGEDSRIEAGAVVGPAVAVGSGCILAEGTTVERTVICPGTFVGEGLELREAVVDRSTLVSVLLGTELELTEEFLLGGLQEVSLRRRFAAACERVLGALAWILTLPLFLLSWALLRLSRRGPVLHEQRVLELPARSFGGDWRTFPWRSFGIARRPAAERNTVEKVLGWLRLDCLPALRDVARGRVHFTGLPPRRILEVQALPEEWRTLYLQGRVGLATLTEVEHGPGASRDQQQACETWYLAHRSPWRDFTIFLRWLFGPRRRRA